MLSDRTDYATTPARRALRSLLYRSGLTARLGPRWWQPTDEAPWLSTVVDRISPIFVGMPTDFDDAGFTANLRATVTQWRDYHERITRAERVVVEPNRCQVIGPDGRLASPFNPHRGLPIYPSAWQYRGRRTAIELDEAIVFDGSAGRNLYHFIVDSLMALAWLDEEPGLLPANLPLIVNRRIADHAFFRHLLARSPTFANRPWFVLESGQFASVHQAYNVRAAPLREDLWRRVRSWYGHVSHPHGRRLFVSRDHRRYGRGLRNEAEVARLLDRHGFEPFYAERHSLEAQQAAFEETDYIVGLHGMALVQQLFMPAGEGRLLELMPANRPQVEYLSIAWLLGRRYYDVLVGSALDADVAYEVDLAHLEEKLEVMLNLGGNQRQFGNTLLSRVPA